MRRGLLAGLIALSLSAGDALAATAPGDGTLSTRLFELSSPDLRSATAADQAEAVSLVNRGAGSLMREGSALLVEIRTTGAPRAALPALRDAGANVTHVSDSYRTVTAGVDERDLRAVAAVAGVEFVQEVITPMVGAVENSDDGGAAGVINTCATGVVSEGNVQLNAGAARTQFDVDGSGIKVGVLSDSYDVQPATSTRAADDVASGDLPGPGNPCGRTEPVQVLDESDTVDGDEGRAMIQIVHDIAPGASLAFATAFGGQTVFADNIRALSNSGAKVIVDDIIYFTEPVYQDGIVANAVREVTQQGVSYFSMAFNNNGLGLNSYEAPAYRTTTCPTVVANLPGPDDCMDFDPGGVADNMFDINVTAGAFRLSFNWAEAQQAVGSDFDIHLLNTGGTVISFSADDDNLTNQTPIEFMSGTIGSAGARQIVIQRFSGTANPRLKFVSNDNGANRIQSTQAVATPDVQGPTIYGHNGTSTAQTVGAVPFNNSATMEPFSSRGPVTHLFGPVQTSGPAPALGAPQVLAKPDVSATDRGINTFFGGGNRFAGTSAAAPHAAAVGALQLEANPSLTNTQMMAAQKTTARPVGAFGPSDMGAGLIDAQAAIAAQPPAAPSVAITERPASTTTDNTPAFQFATTGDLASVTCTVDTTAQTCTSPFTTTALPDGNHTVAITATDFFGQSTPASASFAVDTTGPLAPTFSKGPKKKTKSRKAKFIFSGEPGATFVCAVDDKLFKPCASPTTIKVKKAKPKPKKHTFAVEATDALGNAGQVAVYKWKVVKKKRRR